MLKFSITASLARRILVLDGGLGTMVQGYDLSEEDYRGEPFREWPVPLKGCNEALALTRPDVLTAIHEAYLKAGADIISTDTFNANALSLADQMLDFYVYDICRTAASIARAAADRFTLSNPSKPRFVAGSVGPGNRSGSISPDVNNPAARAVTFAELRQVYYDQARGLIDGGADLILIETFFDTLNAKAAIFAVEELARERNLKIPIMVSGTLTDVSGRTLSGQTVEAFYASVHHGNVISVGLNCGLGADKMQPYIERLAAVASCAVSAHPNAGLPDSGGCYGETPQMMAEAIEGYLEKGLLNIVGGCCGTTPMHIAEIATVAARFSPRTVAAPSPEMLLSGLEPIGIGLSGAPVVVGEQADATVSDGFAAMIRERRYEAAVNVSREAVEAGSPLAAVCVDDALGNGVTAIRDYLNLSMAVPEAARVPVMLLSSEWNVLEAGMQCIQGKPLVGPLSLGDGDDEFVRRVSLAARYGAAVIVALADERGMAGDFERKIAVMGRIAGLLPQTGLPVGDVAVDPGVHPLTAGTEQGARAAGDFLRACAWVRTHHPEIKLCGKIDRISSAFDNDPVIRTALNSLFLRRAAAVGLDIALVNPQWLESCESIPPALSQLCEAAIGSIGADAGNAVGAVAALEEYALQTCAGAAEAAERIAALAEPPGDVASLSDAVTRRLEALSGLEKLYRTGKIPFATWTAGVDRAAEGFAGICAPEAAANAAKVLFATLADDGYDADREPIKRVLAALGCRIADLGVVTDPKEILSALEMPAEGISEAPQDRDVPVAVVLRGLTSRAVRGIAELLVRMQKQGLQLPVLVGGPAASELQTAVGLAPQYGGGTVVCAEGVVAAVDAVRRMVTEGKEMYLIDLQMSQMALREEFADRKKNKPFRTLAEARARALQADFSGVKPPRETGRKLFVNYDLRKLIPLINWSYFFGSAGMPGRYPDLLDDPVKGEQARRLFDDAQRLLEEMTREGVLQAEGIVALYPARRDEDDIVLYEDLECTEELQRLPQLRNQQTSQQVNLSLADFVAPAGAGVTDCVGVYALTVGQGLDALQSRYREAGDESSAKWAGILADRLCDAFAEELHRYARVELWGIEADGELGAAELLAGGYPGIRPAFGIPSCPDRSYRKTIFGLLGVAGATGMELDDNYAIRPGASACGLIVASPEARNFTVGQIDAEQLEDYARRRGMTQEQLRRLIPQYIQQK